MKNGKYYATIIIPEDFTTKTLSLVTKTLQKPEIIYIVNEKSNAIAPKITDKGVSTIKEEIDSNVVKTVNGILFKIFNEIGIGIEDIKPRLLQLIDIIIEIDNKMPEIKKCNIGLLISIVFTMIIYTLVSIFGNVGKVIAVILLVLQVAASGGTFPIEVTSKFFQTINPLLPFTYAIGAMRESVAGVAVELLIKDIIILLLYFVGAIIIGLTLKGPINKSTKKLIDKLKESELIGH